jgi:hypothetical protein
MAEFSFSHFGGIGDGTMTMMSRMKQEMNRPPPLPLSLPLPPPLPLSGGMKVNILDPSTLTFHNQEGSVAKTLSGQTANPMYGQERL